LYPTIAGSADGELREAGEEDSLVSAQEEQNSNAEVDDDEDCSRGSGNGKNRSNNDSVAANGDGSDKDDGEDVDDVGDDGDDEKDDGTVDDDSDDDDDDDDDDEDYEDEDSAVMNRRKQRKKKTKLKPNGCKKSTGSDDHLNGFPSKIMESLQSVTCGHVSMRILLTLAPYISHVRIDKKKLMRDICRFDPSLVPLNSLWRYYMSKDSNLDVNIQHCFEHYSRHIEMSGGLKWNWNTQKTVDRTKKALASSRVATAKKREVVSLLDTDDDTKLVEKKQRSSNRLESRFPVCQAQPAANQLDTVVKRGVSFAAMREEGIAVVNPEQKLQSSTNQVSPGSMRDMEAFHAAQRVARAGPMSTARSVNNGRGSSRTNVYTVRIPVDVKPGDAFQIDLQSEVHTIRCPPSARPGQNIHVSLPKPVPKTAPAQNCTVTARKVSGTKKKASASMNSEKSKKKRRKKKDSAAENMGLLDLLSRVSEQAMPAYEEDTSGRSIDPAPNIDIDVDDFMTKDMYEDTFRFFDEKDKLN